jgi:hypothetical protein
MPRDPNKFKFTKTVARNGGGIGNTTSSVPSLLAPMGQQSGSWNGNGSMSTPPPGLNGNIFYYNGNGASA